METIFKWTSLRVSPLLVVFVIGICLTSRAQVAPTLIAGPKLSPVPEKTKPVQQQDSERTNIVCETAAKKAAQLSAHGSHTVTVSWKPSVPTEGDPVKCYVVYRGLNSFDERATPVGVIYAPETTFVNHGVEPGSYSYAVKAVSQHQLESKFSEVLPVRVR
jgi:hypothetical protein